MMESYNRFALEVERSQRKQLMHEAWESRMEGCSLRKELGRTKLILVALGKQLVKVGLKLQDSAQFVPVEVYIQAAHAD